MHSPVGQSWTGNLTMGNDISQVPSSQAENCPTCQQEHRFTKHRANDTCVRVLWKSALWYKTFCTYPPGTQPQPPVFSDNSIFHEQKEFAFLPEPSEPTWTIMARTRISLQELEFGQRENQAFGPLRSEPHFKERLGTHMAVPHWVAKTKCYRRMTERGAGHGNSREGERKTLWNWREGIKGRKPCVAGRGETAGDCC